MYKSRLTIAIILLLTLMTTWDVYANRSAVFDGWIAGFNVAKEPWQGEVKQAGKEGQETASADGITMVIIKANQGSVKVRGADTGDVTCSYRLTASARTTEQANEYVGRLAVTIAPGTGAEGQLVVDFTEPNVRPNYISRAEAALDITVPAGVSVLVEGICPVDVEGIAGDANVVSAGPTRVSDVGGDVLVTARPGLEASVNVPPGVPQQAANPVTITGTGGNLDVTAGLSTVKVDGVKGWMRATVSAGKLEAAGVQGAVTLKSQMTAVTLENPGGAIEADCTSGSLYMTGVRGSATLTGTGTLVKFQPARGAGFQVKANLTMSGLFSDYDLETVGDSRIHSEVEGRIGDGANEFNATLIGGTLEIREP